jgi:hypothetical protein
METNKKLMELDLCQLKEEIDKLVVACGHLLTRAEWAEKLLEAEIRKGELHIMLETQKINRLKSLLATVRRTPETIA